MKTTAEKYSYSATSDSNTVYKNILRFIGNNQNIIELGAGPGSLARPLVEDHHYNVSAIEIDPECITILEQFCKQVWKRDLNQASWQQDIPQNTYDVLLLADVLEHLLDPLTTLKQAISLINDNGSVIISLPHASHSVILSCLLNNDFSYRDTGLLDRTHLRFFGLKNMQTLVEDAGLAIIDFGFIKYHPNHTEFADVWKMIPENFRTLLMQRNFADVYQVVIHAVPIKNLGGRKKLSLISNDLRYIAFYLPQFHPIPENDAWWGKGFTEWTNVTKAQPLFPNHYQPHLPSDLGFYDLRVPEVKHEQIALAKQYGLDAFCFHYYWFNGKRLLEKPLFDFLEDKTADIQFCLCWANENWTRKWDGAENEVLITQEYGPDNDLAFIKDIMPFLRDPRYLRVNNAPLLIVYRPQHLPTPLETIARWRDYCRHVGLGAIHLVAALTHGNIKFKNLGFDAGVEFPPHNMGIMTQPTQKPTRNLMHLYKKTRGALFNYPDIARFFIENNYPDKPVYRCVFPSWDNTARVGENAHIVPGNPENYERWLKAVSEKTLKENPIEERLIFINAWNEWAEGAHLEPDRKYGHAFLQATYRVKNHTPIIDMNWENPPIMKWQNLIKFLPQASSIPTLIADALKNIPILYVIARFFYRAVRRVTASGTQS